MASAMDLSALENDPRLFLYTSLTAGSSHIITATSRLETILKANKIPFQAIDTATDEKARRLWQRRAGQRKLPGLVKEGYVLGDLQEIEDWNEFGELKENIGPVPANNAAPPGGQTGVNVSGPPLPVIPTATGGTANATQPPPSDVSKAPKPILDSSKSRPLPDATRAAAEKEDKEETSSDPLDEQPNVETMSSAPNEKQESISAAKEFAKHHPAFDHLSAPASRIQSGTATPAVEAAGEGNVAENENVAEKVEGLQIGEGARVNEQDPKEGEDATKSVED